MNNIRFDFFFRAETSKASLKGMTYVEYWTERGSKMISVDLPADTTLAEAMIAGRAAGVPKGSHRSGCFQVQTDLGIYSSTHEFGRRIDPNRPSTFTFSTWEQLEAEELAEEAPVETEEVKAEKFPHVPTRAPRPGATHEEICEKMTREAAERGNPHDCEPGCCLFPVEPDEELETFSTEPQYHNAPGTRDDKGTCPCCLKTHCLVTVGRMVRHGWKETGRIRGQWGNGFQWGNCHGWQQRPLEQTDEDALKLVVRLDKQLAKVEERAAYLRSDECSQEFIHTHDQRDYGHGSLGEYVDQLVNFVGTLPESLNVEIHDTTKRNDRYRRITHDRYKSFSFTIEPGFEGLEVKQSEVTGKIWDRGVALKLPSWEARRQLAIANVEASIANLKAHRQRMVDAIESFRAKYCGKQSTAA